MEHVDDRRDGLAQGLRPAITERLDQRRVLRMTGREPGDGRIPVLTGIERLVPLGETDRVEERLDLGVVGQQRAVEMARVPVDQDRAEVEDDRRDRSGQRASASRKASSASLGSVVWSTSPPNGRSAAVIASVSA